MLRNKSKNIPADLVIDSARFEAVEGFKYLGVVLIINDDPAIPYKTAANTAYFAHIKLF